MVNKRRSRARPNVNNMFGRNNVPLAIEMLRGGWEVKNKVTI